MSAVRKLQFCAGHRLYQHESKCRHLHGHNYKVFLHAQSTSNLDQIGRVIDFSILKGRFLPWIEENWDHGFIVWQGDLEAIAALRAIPDQKLFLLDSNPTAENLALYLLNQVAPKLLAETDVSISKIVLWETENCFVEVTTA
ncbi:6-carboxytetrahydropterin synthase [bacterium]|nr:6-carboxytetrahydropterin synthase [bacterium]MBP9807247.1 6-carboxytetrahydropterin synthase [bacterium]